MNTCRNRGRAWSVALLAIALVACDGGGDETDAGNPGIDGGSSGLDSGGTPVDAGDDEDGGGTVTPDGGGSGATPGQCTEVCVDDDDCAATLGCVDGRCACTSDELCQVAPTWTDEGCASDDDCTDTFTAPRCVEWAETTFCVPDDTDRFGCGIGDPRSKVEVTLADGTGTIQTCVREETECREDGTCGVVFACEEDSDCLGPGPAQTPHCDVASGRCVCTEDPEDSCTSSHPALQCRTDGTCGCLEDDICPSDTGGHCDIATGTCGCVATEDCPDGEICHEGQCRCSVADGCGDVFISPTNPGTTLECIPL